MKFRFFVLFVVFLFAACQKPKMLLPVNDNPGVTNINNISQIYIFFEQKNGDTVARLNAGQRMSTTHWAVHIDRRLQLKHLIKHLDYLYQKRHNKRSIHYKPGMHLYFTHVDTVRNVLALNRFDSLQILSPFYHSRQYAVKYAKTYPGTAVHIDLKPGEIQVNDTVFPYPVDKSMLGNYLKKVAKNQTKVNLFLNADYNITYGQFNDLYGFLKKFDTLHMRLIAKEFWYNPKETAHD